MNIKQFNENNITNIKKQSPQVYKDTLELSIPFFVLHKFLFEMGDKTLKEKYDLTQSELDVLGSLYYAGGENYSLTPTKLYEIMLFSSGGMTKVLKKLESKKYITRKENLEDKRAKLVCLSTLGKEITTKALKEVIEDEDKYFSKLDNNERDEFKRLLYKILA